ncbi:DUF5677 domain-containing protein [Chitinophaga cymbidii]|uniref:Uncharacterized protein n=1 Tax=Chitinophaga cymbidii TaxID=1096750 RepID=A0A512RG49_9BACT|nr:DUF5677 domain-containing protein [Chitinophaga cymbidii]GEP94681.1 hypothetical protein CCY01nite_09410 [Chitinophaga cymbidii]
MSTLPDRKILPEIPGGVLNAGFKFRFEQVSEIVNFGTNILAHDFQTRMKGDECLAPVALFRHSLDLMDSIANLLMLGSSDTAKILLRTLFETVLYLDYIFVKDTDRRSLNYLIHERYTTVSLNSKYDLTTKTGIANWDILKKEGWVNSIDISQYRHSEIYDEVELWLKTGKHKNIIDEIERIKGKNRNSPPPQWYTLFNGPKTIKELARTLKMLTFYEIYYRTWSNNVHSGGRHSGVFKFNYEGKVEMMHLRNHSDIDIVSQNTCNFGLHILNKFIRSRLPDKLTEFQTWYDGYKKEHLSFEN